MMCETLVGKIVQQKLLAEAKYPHFADSFFSRVTALDENSIAAIKARLNYCRSLSDSEKPHYSVEATLQEEVLEVMEAAAENRWEDCMMELAQVGSVVLRAMEWVQTNKLNKEPNNA